MKIINSFRGHFDFLSNFSLHGFVDIHGNEWKTSEHYYQAAKTNDKKEKLIIWAADTPGRAKRLGQRVNMVSNWSGKKISVMYRALKMKFDQNKDIQKKLKSTFEYKLIEGNFWHDNYWGNCFCDECKEIEGENYLGNLLMIIRDEYNK
jgi:ribA/ribD-fused uncharacterized protein